MVRKLTAWKTIAVFEKKNSLKKYIYIYGLPTCDCDGKLSNATFSGGTQLGTTNLPLSF